MGVGSTRSDGFLNIVVLYRLSRAESDCSGYDLRPNIRSFSAEPVIKRSWIGPESHHNKPVSEHIEEEETKRKSCVLV